MGKKILFILLFGVVGNPFVCIGFLINVIRISFEAGMINAEALMDDQFKDEAK